MTEKRGKRKPTKNVKEEKVGFVKIEDPNHPVTENPSVVVVVVPNKNVKVKEEEKEGFVKKEDPDTVTENPSVGVVVPPLTESQIARIRLRERWELASVLNFLHVFKPVIDIDLEVSAEEIETALITPNSILSQLHISLLKGIPPVNKNLNAPDAWVTILCKKLHEWWPWVAEGEIPLVAAHGEEISKYKDLDPTVRLMILKALCELRADQDDALKYMNDALKNGTEISTFRKDMLGEVGNGTAYWYDGDSVIGHRLYKEVTKVQFTPRKGKGRLTQPINSYQWETLATNLEEFVQISNKLSSSKVMAEAAVGKIVESEIIPILEGLQKKKERALKRQQKQTMLLGGFLNSHRIGETRSQRNRRPVSYTFDEYDRSIDEALEITKKRPTRRDQKKHEEKDGEHGSEKDVSSNENSDENTGSMEIDDDEDKFRGGGGNDDSDDHNYEGKNDEDEDEDDDEVEDENDNESGGNSINSEKENNDHGRGTRHIGRTQKKKGLSATDVVGLRRSSRTAGLINMETRNNGDTKRMLRERPTLNTVLDDQIVSDSEEESS